MDLLELQKILSDTSIIKSASMMSDAIRDALRRVNPVPYFASEYRLDNEGPETLTEQRVRDVIARAANLQGDEIIRIFTHGDLHPVEFISYRPRPVAVVCVYCFLEYLVVAFNTLTYNINEGDFELVKNRRANFKEMGFLVQNFDSLVFRCVNPNNTWMQLVSGVGDAFGFARPRILDL